MATVVNEFFHDITGHTAPSYLYCSAAAMSTFLDNCGILFFTQFIFTDISMNCCTDIMRY